MGQAYIPSKAGQTEETQPETKGTRGAICVRQTRRGTKQGCPCVSKGSPTSPIHQQPRHNPCFCGCYGCACTGSQRLATSQLWRLPSGPGPGRRSPVTLQLGKCWQGWEMLAGAGAGATADTARAQRRGGTSACGSLQSPRRRRREQGVTKSRRRAGGGPHR